MVIHFAPSKAPMARPIEALMARLMHSRTYNITLRACAVHTRGHKSRDGSYFNPDGGGDSQNDDVAQSWVRLIIASLAHSIDNDYWGTQDSQLDSTIIGPHKIVRCSSKKGVHNLTNFMNMTDSCIY